MEIAQKNEKIRRAIEEYDRLMGDEETRKELERIKSARQETRLALGSARYEGEQSGLRKGEKLERKKNLKNMLKNGLSDEMIIKILDISKQELLKEKELLGVG